MGGKIRRQADDMHQIEWAENSTPSGRHASNRMGGKIRRQADDMRQIEWAEKFDAKRTTCVK
jgi:flavin-binding protein dodecin